MAHLHRSAAAIRISGDNLVPETITELLGCEPTLGYIKGQIRRRMSTGKEVVAKSGMWLLDVADSIPENLDKQVSELLGRLSDDMNVWAQLSSLFDIDIYCGLFMDESNESFDVSDKTLLALGQRGIKLIVDLYGPLCDSKDDSPCP